jgi:hypothetical protein
LGVLNYSCLGVLDSMGVPFPTEVLDFSFAGSPAGTGFERRPDWVRKWIWSGQPSDLDFLPGFFMMVGCVPAAAGESSEEGPPRTSSIRSLSTPLSSKLVA